MDNHRLISGMVDKGTEIVTVNNRAIVINDGKIFQDFASAPAHIRETLRRDMKAQPVKERAMEALVGKNEEAKLEKFAMCQFGALNTTPDIDVNGNLSYPEYVRCVDRPTCNQAGKGCSLAVQLSTNIKLTKAEIRVIQLIGFDNQAIADALFLSVKTVKKHFENIQRKTGKKNKTELAIWAMLNGII